MLDNTAGELDYKTVIQEQPQVNPWLIPEEYPLDEYSVLLFTNLLYIHHLLWSS